MTKWEYKVVHRARGFDKNALPEKWGLDIEAELTRLGESGWELVTVSTRADQPRGGGMAQPDIRGLTTSENWVFKREKA